MPKLKGFSNAKFKTVYNIINLSDLAKLAEKGITTINKEVLLENNVVRRKSLPIKLLGQGELTAKVTVILDKASTIAKEAIEKAGGKLETK
jgi:large subunit ribosomal protein L15